MVDKEINIIKVYIDETKQYELLTRDEEIDLFKKYKAGDENAREKIINSNLRLVLSIASKYKTNKVDFLELVSEGNIGLMKAVEKYDLENGAKFGTFATWWIRYYVSKALNDLSRTIKAPQYLHDIIVKINKLQIDGEMNDKVYTDKEMAKELKIPIKRIKEALEFIRKNEFVYIDQISSINDDDNLAIENVISSYDLDPALELELSNLKQVINLVLSRLTENERYVIEHRFGLNGKKMKTLRDIGNDLMTSKQCVQRIEDRAIYKMRRPENANLLKEYYQD